MIRQGPGGAQECSRGWSGATAKPSDAQPVESVLFWSFAPKGRRNLTSLPKRSIARVPLRAIVAAALRSADHGTSSADRGISRRAVPPPLPGRGPPQTFPRVLLDRLTAVRAPLVATILRPLRGRGQPGRVTRFAAHAIRAAGSVPRQDFKNDRPMRPGRAGDGWSVRAPAGALVSSPGRPQGARGSDAH